MVDIHTCPDRESASRAAAEALQKLFTQYHDVPVLFLVSGGSSFDVLNLLSSDLFNTRITVSVVDERFTTDPAVNNYLQISRTDFYRRAVARGVSVIETVPGPKETVEEMAKRFENDLKTWRISHPDGVIIAMLGIGRDGHTAGIMAYPDDQRTFEFYFEDADVWVMGYDASWRNPYPVRVTVTLPFLRKTTATVVYVVGDEKKKAVISVLAQAGALYITPGRIVHEIPHCLLYTDQSVDTVKI